MKTINEAGNIYGRLHVLERGESSGYGAKWICKCDCGNIILLVGTNLRTGTTNSCGCWRRETSRKKRLIQPGKASFNQLLNTYRFNAKRRKLEWKLSKEEFRSLIEQDCYYCGIQPLQINKSYTGNNGHFLHNGLDRVDNDKGYTLSNIVPCCKQCNLAKRDSNIDDFLTWARAVYEHSIIKGIIVKS